MNAALTGRAAHAKLIAIGNLERAPPLMIPPFTEDGFFPSRHPHGDARRV
jgi:hypothetical protein